MNIGVIGSGAIGQYLMKHINGSGHLDLYINSVLVRNFDKYKHLEEEYSMKLYTDVDEFLNSDIDLVVEAANVETVKALLPTVIKKKDVMLISIGALVEAELLESVKSAGNHRVHLPSGAIGGLDLIQNAKALGNLDAVSITTRKSAAGLIDEIITDEKIVFQGQAKEAIDKFPKNMNISIILSLAGIGVDKTEVTLIADPHADKNTHTIYAKGDFGEAEFKVVNNPLPENQKTSHLAALSVFATLERISSNVSIGN